ncbi:MAG: DUF1801 domain-containing protein [Bacteroidales bacterium]
MAKNKTTENENSVTTFIEAVADENKRQDCKSLITLMKKITGEEPKMWGPAIVGFGSHHYKYESGREGDSPNVSFSPRASSIAIYLSGSFEKREELLQKFGKHKSDKGCIHIKTLADINQDIFKEMITRHLDHVKKLYPAK